MFCAPSESIVKLHTSFDSPSWKGMAMEVVEHLSDDQNEEHDIARVLGQVVSHCLVDCCVVLNEH